MKKLHRKIPVIIEKTRTGYSAFAEQLDVFTTGKDIPSLHSNMLEALNLALNDSGYTVTPDNIKLRLDLRQFFQYYKVLNANFLAERIGMNPSLLSQYVRGKNNHLQNKPRRSSWGFNVSAKSCQILILYES
jgi:hypothetical protein